ncbi:MAG: DnaJ domain-containing protein [Methylobacteriaceae bacterium]|jgi:DnaJ-class molecular chaperone|nr:DnaJ domain-containing protein [Methylobacteriaceae bacterium]
MRNPYTVLGVDKMASAAEIKKAYRKLAKALHPDSNRSDPKAKDKFAEVNAAYELLSDQEKRRQFDAGEIDADGNPNFRYGAAQDSFWRSRAAGAGGNPFGGGQGGFRFSTFEQGFPEDADWFKQFFGGFRDGSTAETLRPRPKKSPDVEVTLTVTLEQIAEEKKVPVTVPGGRKVEVALPRDLKDGQTVRLRGLAPQAGTAPAGDVLLKIVMAPHAEFRVENANIRSVLPLTIVEAVLGASKRVHTLRGDVELTVPPGTDSGKVFRLRLKGLPTGKGYGDHFAAVQIHLPEGEDPDLLAYARKKRG